MLLAVVRILFYLLLADPRKFVYGPFLINAFNIMLLIYNQPGGRLYIKIFFQFDPVIPEIRAFNHDEID